MRQPVQVLVYPVRNVGGNWEVLLLHRVPRLGLVAFWQGVTGGVEEGEEPVDSAKRELAEETGLVPRVFQQINYSYSFPLQDEFRDQYADDVEAIVEYVFVAVVDRCQEPKLSREHDKAQWCSLDRALALLIYPGNIEALKRCQSFLTTQLDKE